MSNSGLRSVVESRRWNALFAWVLVAFLAAMALHNFVTSHWLWAGMVVFLAALAVLPAAAFRDPLAMLPWEVLVLASLPVLSQAFVVGQRVGDITLTGRMTTYLAVAAVALIVAVELDAFTPVRMNYSFAVLFVVTATMAAAGIWAIVQWLSDLYLGTALLLDGRDVHVVERALMWDFVAATGAGVVGGVVFEYYFRRHDRKLLMEERP